MRASNSARSAARFAGPGAAVLLALALVGLSAPAALAAGTLTVTTSYPGVVVSPGSNVTFDLKVKTSAAARVGLEVANVPTGWKATLQGGGFVVDAVETDGKTATDVQLAVTVPDSASGTTHLTVRATGLGQTVGLGVDITVQAAGGDVTLTTDVPSLKDASTATFTFNLTVHNDTPQDQTLVANSTGPTGWTISTSLTGQSQAASAVVKAGATAGVLVTAHAPDGAAAGQYPIDFVATAGEKQLTQQLTVEITGSYTLTMSTPNQVLSTSGTAGTVTEQQLVLSNDGSADITNVKVSATAPTNWKVDFDKATIPSIAAGDTVTVTAQITPSGDAIAGDYSLTFRAAGDQSTNASQEIRFTVETSILWAIVGVVLIVAVFAGLWWVFRRYGRR